MTSDVNSPTEQAMRHFHRHRDIYVLNSQTYSREEIDAFDIEFEEWIADIENQKAYAEVSQSWSRTDILAHATEEKLAGSGVDLSHEKQEIKKKLKVLGGLVVADFLFSILFFPLGILEPLLILAFIYFAVQYMRMPKWIKNEAQTKQSKN